MGERLGGGVSAESGLTRVGFTGWVLHPSGDRAAGSVSSHLSFRESREEVPLSTQRADQP